MPDSKHPGHGGHTLATHESLINQPSGLIADGTPTDPALPETPPITVRNSKVGDIVNYVLPTGRNKGEIRPAIIVRKWGTSPESAVQLQVFTDGTNDYHEPNQHGSNGIMWATSVRHNENKEEGTWHWPEK